MATISHTERNGSIVSQVIVSGAQPRPRSIILVVSVDTSSIMREVIRCCTTLVAGCGNTGIVDFAIISDKILQPFTQDAQELIKTLNAIENGHLEFVSAIQAAVNMAIGRRCDIVLFTDQMVSGNHRGSIENLFGVDLSLHIFSFGPNVDSYVLSEAATGGHGSYTHIGNISTSTVISSFAAACLTTAGTIEIASDSEFICPGYDVYQSGIHRMYQRGVYCVNIGRLMGSPRSVILKSQAKPKIRISVDGESIEVVKSVISVGVDVFIGQNYHCILRRIHSATCHADIVALNEFMKKIRLINTDFTRALADTERDIMCAIENMSTWGGHYLRSLMHAHREQYCLNCMDWSLIFYGDHIFHQERSRVDEIYRSLA